MFWFMQPLKIPLQESLGRQQFTVIAAARVAVPPLPCGQRSRWLRWHHVQKIRGKSFKVCKFIFLIFHQNQLRCIQIYIVDFILRNFLEINKIRCPEKMLSTNALK